MPKHTRGKQIHRSVRLCVCLSLHFKEVTGQLICQTSPCRDIRGALRDAFTLRRLPGVRTDLITTEKRCDRPGRLTEGTHTRSQRSKGQMSERHKITTSTAWLAWFEMPVPTVFEGITYDVHFHMKT